MQAFSSTYRIQFNSSFTFKHLQAIIPYLQKLGIGAIYASPVFKAVSGSTHGYNITDPLCINPEIGTEQELYSIKAELNAAGIKWLQDIVPNHMALHTENSWLMDFFEHGENSRYKHFFDRLGVPGEQLMLAVLDKPLDEAISSNDLRIQHEGGKTYIDCKGTQYPTLAGTYNSSQAGLREFLEKQVYRFCDWRDTINQINYRRFFLINDLICLNIQHKEVFDHYHQYIKKLCDEGIFDGLRVDHIDGLYDPTEYLFRLRDLVGDNIYITVEKILQPMEQLPANWPVQGTTGYEFLGELNNVFTRPDSYGPLQQFYSQLLQSDVDFSKEAVNKKAFILNNFMQGELTYLAHTFKSINPETEQMPLQLVKDVLCAFMVHLPQYRFYGNTFPLSKNEEAALLSILEAIETDRPEAVGILRKVLLQEKSEKAEHFYKRCMQFTGPLMAKGIEDTAMYTFAQSIVHNEVGDVPAQKGISAEDFHNFINKQQRLWPLCMNATATHDTKRGEDARARLNVVSAVADKWAGVVTEWMALNAPCKINNIPDSNEEYFIYQSLLGSYPVSNADDFENRFSDYMRKVLREAKLHSTWHQPDEEYENACIQFIHQLLNKEGAFWKSFEPFLLELSDYGFTNSICSLIIKMLVPGIPDIFQGRESWDFSLVDPDNRRPVNFEKLQHDLNASAENGVHTLWQQKLDGRIKLWLTALLLNLRKQHADIFSKGRYIPLQVNGALKDNILAFARELNGELIAVVVPLHAAAIAEAQQSSLKDINWGNNYVVLPNNTQGLTNLLTNETVEVPEINLADAFSTVPFAIYKGACIPNPRSAGILLHLSSLPSGFGIGDMGPSARNFVDFLNRTCQSYWQLLPVNPTEQGQGNSPYSTLSSFAGNTLFISPHILLAEGLLKEDKLAEHEILNAGRTDYALAETAKKALLESAYACFTQTGIYARQFESFCAKEAYWLDDFALFMVFKKQNNGKPWFQWPMELRLRQPEALAAALETYQHEIVFEKWCQYIFDRQWQALRQYCHNSGVKLIGDIPFYISHDSADVWAHTGLFGINKDGVLQHRAGVPPDAFSDTGQDWGMPVYNWAAMKKDNYAWWRARLKKCTAMFHLVRIDHFRAFSSYWQISGNKQASEGHWRPGPGMHFWKAIQKELGHMPFIAEDLGKIDEPVRRLRQRLNLPGMEVLQFAFEDNLPVSPYIPHNHIFNAVVYTGTHDNNTVKGWWREQNDAAIKRIENYVGHPVSEEHIAALMCRMAYASVSAIAILPMQDVLGLGPEARMNKPAQAADNWAWRLTEPQLTHNFESRLKEWVMLFNRKP